MVDWWNFTCVRFIFSIITLNCIFLQQETFSEEDCSCTYDFAMSGHKGRIVTRDGTPNALTVDGMLVPNWWQRYCSEGASEGRLDFFPAICDNMKLIYKNVFQNFEFLLLKISISGDFGGNLDIKWENVWTGTIMLRMCCIYKHNCWL